MAEADLQKEVLEQKAFVTGRLSETTRYIGFGLLAAYYGLMSSADPYPVALTAAYALPLKFMATCGFLAVFLDYLQYVCGRIAVKKALDRKDKPFIYNKAWLSYRARSVCFVAKQVAALAGSLTFIVIILLAD